MVLPQSKSSRNSVKRRKRSVVTVIVVCLFSALVIITPLWLVWVTLWRVPKPPSSNIKASNIQPPSIQKITNEKITSSESQLNKPATRPKDNDYNDLKKKNTIAYCISLIKCGDHQTTSAGLTDAALILRHSVHMTSVRNPQSGSKYDYEMIAIVHRRAEKCSDVLKKVGFTILVVDPPVQQEEIKGEILRNKIHREWCCGHHEFVKWMPYKLTQYPAVVHVDIDFAFFQPMDEIFDAIIYSHDSPEGRAARAKIPLERPGEAMPERIDAFMTRDWPQVVPGRIPGYQAGFVVVRPDPTVHEELRQIVIEGNYTGGFGTNSGWGGKGYGGFVGAMAMQGLMAYYYDHVRPHTAVEINQCRYNWMGMDIRYRAHPNFRRNHPKVGKCRNDNPKDECEDCMVTDLKDIKSVHFTECRKPWNCVGTGVKGGAKGKAIDTNAGSYEKCMEVVRRWHEYRTDFEQKLFKLTNDNKVLQSASGQYKKEIFMGHCHGEGGKNYSQIEVDDATLLQVPKLYT